MSQPKQITRPNMEAWLAGVNARHGVKITQHDLDRAQQQIMAKYTNGADMMPIYDCPECKDAGFLKIATGDITNPTAVVPCPNSIHEAERRKKQVFGALSGDELTIRIDHINQLDGNLGMLALIGKAARNPWAIGLAYIYGTNGNGKTMAACALYNELVKAHFGPVKYLTLEQYIRFVKAAYDDRNRGDYQGDMSDEQRYRWITEQARCLIIDEFDFVEGKTPATDYNMALIQRTVSDRYRMLKQGKKVFTLLVSNQAPSKLGMKGVEDRLKEFKNNVVLNSAPSQRGGEWGE